MVYLFGSLGFVIGFTGGLFVIRLFLQGYSRKDLLQDKALWWSYGTAVWVFAGLGAGAGIWLYQRTFL